MVYDRFEFPFPPRRSRRLTGKAWTVPFNFVHWIKRPMDTLPKNWLPDLFAWNLIFLGYLCKLNSPVLSEFARIFPSTSKQSQSHQVKNFIQLNLTKNPVPYNTKDPLKFINFLQSMPRFGVSPYVSRKLKFPLLFSGALPDISYARGWSAWIFLCIGDVCLQS